jgi:hypothetical protein
MYEVPDLRPNPRRSQRLRDRTTRDLSHFRNLPEAIRQMIVDIWRAGVRARSFKGWQRPPPIVLGLTHAPWLRDNRVNGMWQWFARMGPGNNAVAHNATDSTLGHSYAYGGNPAHYVLTGHGDRSWGRREHSTRSTHERDDWGTNLTDTFGNTLTKLIEYVLPRHHYDNWGTAEENAERLRLRGIRRVRWVDRMI